MLSPDDATVNDSMEPAYDEAQGAVDRDIGRGWDGGREMALRDGFRAGWKAALKWARAALAGESAGAESAQ